MPDSEESNRRIDAELVDLRSRVAALEQERAALQQQIDALAGECYRFRTLIDHLPDYIFIKDTASRFVVNNRDIELLGCHAGRSARQDRLRHLPANWQSSTQTNRCSSAQGIR